MTLNEDTVRELLDQATPGPWGALFDNEAIETDTSTVLYNTDGAVEWGRNIEHDVPLAALAPELAADWLRMREALEKQLNGINLMIALADMIQPQTEAQQEATTLARALCDDLTQILNGVTNDGV